MNHSTNSHDDSSKHKNNNNENNDSFDKDKGGNRYLKDTRDTKLKPQRVRKNVL